ncbi:unnamed protein product [Rhizoctonia solani]|uniref:DUF7082 domain-containing protein n=1 Tax=Rhizoctonia solani TaxID=456999 RepID=A0A8H3H6F4_9AGAM|nr:unnamed protein product [Rhizoctonia solani]
MASRMPIGSYERIINSESSFETTAVPSGLPSFDPPTAILPQYSHAGRMGPEFNYSSSEGYSDDDDDRPAIALGRTTKILGYEPREGTHRTPIVIRLLFRRGYIHPKTRVCLRVKMGNIPIYTHIEGVLPVDGVGGEWRLHFIAPDPRELDVVGLDVPLIVQTLDVHEATIIDDVCIGAFKFRSRSPTEESHTSGLGYFGPEPQGHKANDCSVLCPVYAANVPPDEGSPSNQTDEKRLATSHQEEASTSALGLMTEAAPGGSAHKRARLVIEAPPRDTVEISKADGDIESPSTAKSFLGQKPGEDTYQVSLGFLDDLGTMTHDWTPEEINNQRRIVEFFCVRTRGRIDVTFAPISVENARNTSKNIVSCIWWQDMEEFIITSVDTINLLEGLVGTKFTTEEKNRIRRNLQGFKPATVSKNHPESEPFFRTLMEFPPPRPRNIEKDVKAFVWSKLPSMLDKVISKYWFVSTPSGSEADESSPRIRVLREIDGSSTESPGMSFQALSASQTPKSTLPSQTEVEPTDASVLEPSPYTSARPSSQGHNQGQHGGFPALEHHLVYPQSSQGSTGSTYDHSDTVMEITGTSIGELHSVSMDGNQISSGYEQMETYPEVMGMSSGRAYVHQTDEDTHNNMQYSAHTPHKYV